MWAPLHLSFLTGAYATLGQFDDAWRCIGEAVTAVETTKERWCQAEVNRTAGEVALREPEPDAAKAEAYFNLALVLARQQQAKSWELRAAMSLARLWRDQGKPQQESVVGVMAAFIYRCPNTGLRIQAWEAEEVTEDENTYQPVTCVMCQQVHLVNPFTGKVLGHDDQ